MEEEVKNEIMFNIQASIELNVDEKQLLNLVKEYEDYYELRAYGHTLHFNKEDGGLIENGG